MAKLGMYQIGLSLLAITTAIMFFQGMTTYALFTGGAGLLILFGKGI